MSIRTKINCGEKGLLCVFAFILFSSTASANNYYFSSTDGDDNRSSAQAQNASTPWKTIDKLNSFFSQLNPGDNILFKSGDIFYGSIITGKSGNSTNAISFSSYGTGNKPQITGLFPVSGWYNAGGQVWEATVQSALQKVNAVIFNNAAVSPGRYPNTDAANDGYMNFETAIGNTSIIDLQLSGYPNWTGGEVVIRKNRWVLDRNPISLHIGNIINYASQSNYGTSAGYGYFIQNHPAALDKEGEWYYRAGGKKFGIYSAGMPADGIVKVSSIQNLVTVDGQSNLVFTNLSFTGANGNAFNINNAQNIQIRNCDVLYSGVNAIAASATSELLLEKNSINLTNSVACLMQYCNNLTIRNNIITNTGTVAGMGDGGSGSYQGIVLSGDNQLVEGNTINNTGYGPISFGGNNVIIKNNLIDGYAFVKDDGGGIYTWNNSQNPPNRSGQVVSGNIVVKGLGAGAGTPEPDKSFAQGIYMDDNTSGVELSGNTVANCTGYGFYIHNAHDLVIKNNTAFNNSVQLEMTHDDVAPIPITNVTLTGNTFVSKLPGQAVAEFKTNGNDINNFGNFDNNYYSRPLADYTQINVLYKENGNYKWGTYSLDGWKALYGKDQNSKASPFSIAAFKVNSTVGNNLYTNGSFDNNINGLYAYSSGNNVNTNWNNGALDGGTLQVNFPWLAGNGNRASVIIGVGNITASKNYVLRFSIKGTNEHKALDAYLRVSGAPYVDITPRKSLPISASRADYEILLTPTASERNASIGLEIPEQSGPVYIDNIQLVEANVTMTNPDDSIRLVYNASANTRSFPLDGTFADIANNNYSGSISVTPYASSVLLKKSSDQPVETANCQATGVIVREQWDNIAGDNVSNIPTHTAPSSTTQLTSFEAPSSIGDNYGARIRGYICPPQTGNYTFWVAADDGSELWLSTDDNPANKVKIAYSLYWTDIRQYTKYASQKSTLIYLQAGHKYYIEALHKESGGGDNLSVAWQMPNGTMEAPIAGSRLSPFIVTATPLSPQTIDFATLPAVTLGVAPFLLTATASSGLPVTYTVFSGPAMLSGNLLSITGTGNVTIEATQPGNTTYNAATPVTQSFAVLAAPETASCVGTGSITREYWGNVGGTSVGDIPLQTTPTSTSQLTLFEAPVNVGNYYGARVRGYICPPQTGNYTFWIAADDGSELWLSTDDNPANKVRIAYSVHWTDIRQYDKYPSQKSITLYLKVGYRYYVEALQKNGYGSSHLSVAWQLPNGTVEAPVLGSRLIPFGNSTTQYVKQANIANGTVAVSITKEADVAVKTKFTTGNLLNVTPSLVHSNAVVEIQLKEAGKMKLDLVDQQGRVVKQIANGLVAENALRSKFQLYTSNLSAGLYIVRLVTQSGTITKKIIVER